VRKRNGRQEPQSNDKAACKLHRVGIPKRTGRSISPGKSKSRAGIGVACQAFLDAPTLAQKVKTPNA
jgi:hypothetical protein